MKPIARLCIEMGTYINARGEKKKKRRDVGIELEDEDGHAYIVLDKTINYAVFTNRNRRNNSYVYIKKIKIKNKRSLDNYI